MGKASSEPTELVECATPPPPSPAWWKPYEDTPVPPLLRNYVAFRWLIMTPLQYEMISRPVRLTIGEVLALVPLMALLAVAIVSWDTGSSGSLAQPALIIAFVFAARNSPFTFLIGVPFERRIWYHKAAAFCSVLSGAAHLTIAYVKGNPRVKGTDYEWTGLVLIGCMGALVVTSFYIIRRKLFEIWYFLHWVLFLTLIPFAVMHGAGLILIGVGFWLLDVFFRNTYLTFFTLPKTAEFRSLPGDVVEVAFRNQNRTLLTEETPGSWYYLSVQRLGIFQFHPFSISSCPNSDVTTLHIRSTCRVEQKHQSSWTRQLLELVREEEAKVQAGSPVQLDVLLEGPYGSPSVDISGPTYKYFILGSGGIGLTPMVAVQRSLEQQAKRGRDVKKIWFHWSVRDELVQGVAGAGLLETDGMTDITCYLTSKIADNSASDLPSSCRVECCRPDPKRILENARNDIVHEAQAQAQHSNAPHSDVKEIRVAVLFCGPVPLERAYHDACKEVSGPCVKFDFHSEEFEF